MYIYIELAVRFEVGSGLFDLELLDLWVGVDRVHMCKHDLGPGSCVIWHMPGSKKFWLKAPLELGSCLDVNQ